MKQKIHSPLNSTLKCEHCGTKNVDKINLNALPDENFDNRILDGLRHNLSDFDMLRVQDTEIYQESDMTVLEWAVNRGRIILSHDVQTMIGYAYDRVKAGLPMPGLIEVHKDCPIGLAIDELTLIIGAGIPSDFDQQVRFIPLQ